MFFCQDFLYFGIQKLRIFCDKIKKFYKIINISFKKRYSMFTMTLKY